MNITKILVAAAGLVLLWPLSVRAKGWQGIVPLQSTRTDVERLLGRSTDQCRCLYETNQYKVHVLYSGMPCEQNKPYHYNVPQDTVLEIRIQPKLMVRLDKYYLFNNQSMRLKHSGFEFVSYYINEDEGVVIETGTYDSKVISITFRPIGSEKVSTCEGEWIFDPAPPIKIDELTDLDLNRTKKRLDAFVKVLKQEPNFNGYIVANCSQHTDEIKGYLELVKDYLVSAYEIDPSRIVTLLNKSSDKPKIQFFLWPRSWRGYL